MVVGITNLFLVSQRQWYHESIPGVTWAMVKLVKGQKYRIDFRRSLTLQKLIRKLGCPKLIQYFYTDIVVKMAYQKVGIRTINIPFKDVNKNIQR
jgi:hypothetical protein